jgi:hypothetical protein
MRITSMGTNMSIYPQNKMDIGADGDTLVSPHLVSAYDKYIFIYEYIFNYK